MKKFLLASIVFGCFHSWAGEIKYPFYTIPKELLKNANVVKRMEETVFEIRSTKETVYHYKYALTILNESGDEYAAFAGGYDQLKHIESIEGSLYDAFGKLVRKMKNKDLQDRSAFDGLMGDDRVKTFDFYCKSYPYTVEFETVIKYDHSFYFPAWYPQEHSLLSVENSVLTVIAPEDYLIRYKNFNYKNEPVQAFEKNKKTYTWQVQNLTAIKKEFASPKWHEITPCVTLAPSQFELQGIKGDMTTWKEFGKFIYQLKKDRDELPDNVKQKIIELTANAHSDLEKIKLLYSFLQQNTRYISIQLGIGGWQPFDATYVNKKGYGDCKALSNYMYSLLKAAGIRSSYALIMGGDYEHYLTEDFPSNQFNHVVLCVPMQKDTLWLECTSQSVPAGYMGEFTGNRKALLIDEDGGTLVSTPRYGLNENILSRNIKAKMNIDGSINMKIATKYSGVEQDYLSMIVNALSKEKIEKYLQKNIELATYHINDFRYEETKAIVPQLKEELDITVPGYATVSGKRIFIVPNILNRNGSIIEEDTSRKFDFVFDSEFKDEDNYEIEIPEGYQLEYLPQDVTIKSMFGNYTSSVKLDGNKIIFHRVMENFSGRFDAKTQGELIKFYADIYKADRSKMVLVK